MHKNQPNTRLYGRNLNSAINLIDPRCLSGSESGAHLGELCNFVALPSTERYATEIHSIYTSSVLVKPKPRSRLGRSFITRSGIRQG